MTLSKPAVLAAMLALGAALPAPAQPDTEAVQRAAVLVYRQALHPDGDALALAARVMTERAGADAESDAQALTRLRDRVLEAARGLERPAKSTPGSATDQVAVMVARHDNAARAVGAPRLWTAWQQRESRRELEDLLPYLLERAEAGAGDIWHEAIVAAEGDETLAGALAPVVTELAGVEPGAALEDWLAASPALEQDRLAVAPGDAWRATVRSMLASALANPAEVSPVVTARLRAQWFLVSRADSAESAGLALAGLWIGLRANTDGIASGDPVRFVAALIEGAQRLAVGPDSLSAGHRSELQATVDMLRDIPADTIEAWSRVDRNLPGLFKAVLETLAAAASNEAGTPPSAAELQQARARLTLLDDDLEAYLMQPFREPVQQALTSCLPLAEESASSCRTRFQDWGLQGAGIPEASGDVGGPFLTEYLLRELDLNHWQRVNYLRGFWRQLLGRECTSRAQIRNAMEWALAARAYLATLPEGPASQDDAVRSGLGSLADAGLSLTADLQEFAACRAQGRGPIRQALAGYESSVNRLAGVLNRASRAFRDEVLAAGADIELDAGADQATEYVPGTLTVGPCGGTPSCGVSVNLPASEALYERFPAPFRVADQSGLGSLSLCYSDVSWVERQAETVRAGGGVMANYRGHLGFRLRGRYATGGETRDVFVLRLVSGRDYTYLFAPDRPAVLADPCPQEYQGQMEAGELPETSGWLVPRRLTFLSGERTSPTRLFAENWLRGEGWLDRLAAGEGVTVEKAESGDDLTAFVARHLEQLRDRRSAHLYERLLAPIAADADSMAARELTETAQQLIAMRRALDASIRVLMPRTAMYAAQRRSVLHGDEALLGTGGIRAWRDEGRNPLELPEHARARVDSALDAWRAPSAEAEMPPFVAHALIELLARVSHWTDDSRE